MKDTTTIDKGKVPVDEIKKIGFIAHAQLQSIYPDILEFDKLFFEENSDEVNTSLRYAIITTLLKTFHHSCYRTIRKVYGLPLGLTRSFLLKSHDERMQKNYDYRKAFLFLEDQQKERLSYLDLLKKTLEKFQTRGNSSLFKKDSKKILTRDQYQKAISLFEIISSLSDLSRKEICSSSREWHIVFARVVFVVYFHFLYPEFDRYSLAKLVRRKICPAYFLHCVEINNSMFHSVNENNKRAIFYRYLFYGVSRCISDIT